MAWYSFRSLPEPPVAQIVNAPRKLSIRARARGFAAILLVGRAGTLGAELLGVGGSLQESRGAEETKKVEAVTFAGRVIDSDSERPIAGATIVVTRSIYALEGNEAPGGNSIEQIDATGRFSITFPSQRSAVVEGKAAPAWVGRSTVQTDARGRFTIMFSPEQVAERRLSVVLERIAHPDFVPRKAFAVPVANLLRAREFGGKPFFETIRLERGVEFFGQIVTPQGKPAARVPLKFGNWGWGNREPDRFTNDDQCETDAGGRFRLRMARTQALTIEATPSGYAPLYRFWGTDRPGENPNVWAPADLGRIVLKRGVLLKGLLVDVHARPIAGQTVAAIGNTNIGSRFARTDAEGKFAFAPLRPGNYTLYGEGQSMYGGIDYTRQPMPASARVITPIKIYLEESEPDRAIILRETPTVEVTVRFVDSQGKPAQGYIATLTGMLPNAEGKPDGVGAPVRVQGLTDIEKPEPDDTGGPVVWSAQRAPDASGTIRFQVPKGLQSADFSTMPPNETISYKTRMEKGGPIRFWGGGQLDTLDADRTGIEIISYRAPTVVCSIVTDEGESVSEATVRAGFTRNGGGYASHLVKQSDGRYRTISLMPDHEYQFTASAPGWVPMRVEWVNLPEGASKELRLVVRRPPKPPAVGELAPPFLVMTLTGRVISLADLKGKFVLLHFWGVNRDRAPADLAELKAIHTRFAADERFALVDVALNYDRSEIMGIVERYQIPWDESVLRDDIVDPIAQAYGARRPSKTFLIDPDGKLVAKDLQGSQIVKAVTDSLGRK